MKFDLDLRATSYACAALDNVLEKDKVRNEELRLVFLLVHQLFMISRHLGRPDSTDQAELKPRPEIETSSSGSTCSFSSLLCCSHTCLLLKASGGNTQTHFVYTNELQLVESLDTVWDFSVHKRRHSASACLRTHLTTRSHIVQRDWGGAHPWPFHHAWRAESSALRTKSCYIGYRIRRVTKRV